MNPCLRPQTRSQFGFQPLGWSVVVLLVLLFAGPVFASVGYVRDYSQHNGYVSDVSNEQDDPGQEIPLMQKPERGEVSLHDRIFDSTISKEFEERYKDKFGRTEPERVYNSPNKDTYYDDLYTLQGTPEQVNDQRRSFAEYMIRRLAEYHADRIFKSDPSLRPVYEAKERLSAVKVEVDTFKFDVRYDLAGNIIDIRAHHPFFDTRVSITLTGGSVYETDTTISKQLTPTISAEERLLAYEAKLSTVIKKKINNRLSTNYTFSACVGDSDRSQRETLYLSGLTYNF